MRMRKIQPAFVDDRGNIFDVLYPCNVTHVGYISSKAGAIRGNHYHKETIQHIFITKGEMRYWFNPYVGYHDRDAQYGNFTEGWLLTSDPYEIHAMEMIQDTEFVVLAEGKRAGIEYESDTFRVPSIVRKV